MVTQLHFMVPADPGRDKSRKRTASKRLTPLECQMRRNMENLHGIISRFPQLPQLASDVGRANLHQLVALSRHIPSGPARYSASFSSLLEVFIDALMFTDPKEKNEEKEAAGKRLRKWRFILGQNDINVFRPIRTVLALKSLHENKVEDFCSFLTQSLSLKPNKSQRQYYYTAFWQIVSRSRRWWDIDSGKLYYYLKKAVWEQAKRNQRDCEMQEKPYAGRKRFEPLNDLADQFRTPNKAIVPKCSTEESARQRELFEIIDTAASPRQKQILELLVENVDRKEIAKLLKCSRSTVDVQISRLKEKIRSSP